jgi:uncharacterized protein YndB with AHSA1/START domain
VSDPIATATVEVPVGPDEAFRLFTDRVGDWWQRGQRFWHDPDHGISHRFEPFVGGRFLEVLEGAAEWELGRVTTWEPGRRLGFTWRQANWLPEEVTDVEVTFEGVSGGTRVRLVHSGFERVTSDVGCDLGYQRGWRVIVGWYAAAA